MASSESFVSVQEAAKILNCGISTVRKMCQEEKIQGVQKVGNGWLIPRTSLNQSPVPNQTRGWPLGKTRLNGEPELPSPPVVSEQVSLAHKIAIFNQAGGVGKTTIVRDLGYELASRGYKTLLVDADPQATLSTFFDFNPAERPEADLFWSTIYRGTKGVKPTVFPTQYANLHLGLANRELKRGELELLEAKDQGRLRGFLKLIHSEFEFILFDCSPAISEITIQVLFAVDSLVIPVQTQAKSVVAFGEIQYEIGKAQERRMNMDLSPLGVLGIIPTMFRQATMIQKHHFEEMKNLCELFDYALLPPIHDSIKVSEAGSFRKPLKNYDKKCRINDDIEQICSSLLTLLSRPLEK